MIFDSITLPIGRAYITKRLSVATFGKSHVHSEVGREAAKHVCQTLGYVPAQLGELYEAACRGYANEVAAVASTIRVSFNGFDVRMYYSTYRLNKQSGKREYIQTSFLDMAVKDAKKKLRSVRAQRDSLDMVAAVMEFAIQAAEQTGAATPRAGLAASGVQLNVYVR